MIFPSSIFSRCVWLCLVLSGVSRTCAAGELWVTAYYPKAAQEVMPVPEIDFGVVTHIVQFALTPNSDGSLNVAGITTSQTNAAELVQRAHAAGRKALICVGGADSGSGFQGASAPSHRAAFIVNLIRSMNAGNYDGIDLDWEPVPAADFHQFTNLVLELRAALDLLPTRKLLTAAVSAYPPYGDAPDSECKMLAALQPYFDQINIMTYDISGPYAGWVTWFNSPIYDGGWRFPSTERLLPSLDGAVKNFITNGVNPAKLGVGVAFYGDVWIGGMGTSTGGVSLPRESWQSPPIVTQLPYSEIMETYYKPEFYHWDEKAQAAYLSLKKPDAPNGGFVSYDDEHTCGAKISFARQNGLGGVMIWQLGQGHRANFPEGRRDPLINAIGRAIASPKR
jgi:chitinase